MTLEAMLKIVRILSNSCWVRWWAHYNYPQTKPWKIAFSAFDNFGLPVDIDAQQLPPHYKFQKGGFTYYVFERLDENGELYHAQQEATP